MQLSTNVTQGILLSLGHKYKRPVEVYKKLGDELNTCPFCSNFSLDTIWEFNYEEGFAYPESQCLNGDCKSNKEE
jgi:hypothetical protein